MSYRDQRLKDLEAVAIHQGRGIAAAQIFTSVPGLVGDYTDVRWLNLSTGRFALVRPLTDMAVRSARFSVMTAAGAAADVLFTFAGGVLRPRVLNEGLDPSDRTPIASELSAFTLPGFTRTFTVTRTVNEVIRHVELFFPEMQKLAAGVWYAFGIIPEFSGESAFCPANNHPAFSINEVGGVGAPPTILQLTAAQSAGPLIELRDDSATRFLTGGAAFRRF